MERGFEAMSTSFCRFLFLLFSFFLVSLFPCFLISLFPFPFSFSFSFFFFWRGVALVNLLFDLLRLSRLSFLFYRA